MSDDGCKKTDAGRPKEASGIVVYLMEELGDARLRCAQLKKHVKDATDLVEKSEHRDHLFEIAGNLIYGIPDVLLKLDKALDATALAAARLDYEEIKNNLRPEKADELETALNDTRLRYLNRRSYAAPTLDKSKVEQWMRHNIAKFVTNTVDVESLAEAACHELDLYDGDDVPGDLYKWAADVARSTGHQPYHHHASSRHETLKETSMNAKSVAYYLNKIADLTDKQGRVPVAAVMTLVAKLETGSKRSAVMNAKVSTAFRNIAKQLPTQKHPSRMAIAGLLRRIVGDTLQVGVGYQQQQQQGQSQQQQAQMQQEAWRQQQQQAGAGEQFQKHNPGISDEEAKVIDEMHAEHKDVVKDKSQESQQQQQQ